MVADNDSVTATDTRTIDATTLRTVLGNFGEVLPQV
eukprot:COSAG02_NODE_107_length_36312_cov_45.037942_34_plen_36_part_00